jgi:hypothetical protein
MYFKSSFRHNPATDKIEAYHRIVESYRNETGRVCHRTLLNVGFIRNQVTVEHLNQIIRILRKRLEAAHGVGQLFGSEPEPYCEPIVRELSERFWDEMVSKRSIDVGQKAAKKPTERQRNMVFEESIRHPDVREIGGEWLCQQALNQLQLPDFLSNIDFSDEEVQLATTQIISRALYPASELQTARWIRENSAVCDLTRYPIKKITKDRLYRSALRLFAEKDRIEQFLSLKTNQMFDIEDKIYIYDLTNTYFEGSKRKSKLAKFGRSKEKRSDCKIVVLALVINPQGFIKYSAVFEGNMVDCKTLLHIVLKLRGATSSQIRATVVIDAGIATEENLQMLLDNGFDYVCVSRSKLKNYTIDPQSVPIEVEDRKQQKIRLQKVVSEKHKDYFLKISSDMKKKKEVSMNNRFQEGFEKGLKIISASLSKKSGIKKEDKVKERVSRLKEKYRSVSRFYDITYTVETETVTNRKTKETSEVRTVKEMSWKVPPEDVSNAECGTYFLRTSLEMSEKLLWDIYNIIREIEYSFRTLKTDLDLRPIYHKNDRSTMAHLNLGLLAYWVVNTVRYQLKQKQIRSQWKEIVRIMNTQKAVTTVSQNRYDEVLISHRTSDPQPRVQAIYDALGYPPRPFTKRKFVVHKSEFEKMDLLDYRRFPP